MAKSLQAFTAWAFAKGQVANPNGTYPGQCVSAVQQYLNQVFGIPYAPRGNAKDFVPPTFVAVGGAPRPGDIIRYGRNYGGGYGHIGWIDENGKFVDQNGTAKLRMGRRATPFPGYNALFRPTKAFNVRDVAAAPAARWATVTGAQGANVRDKPTSASPLAGSKFLPKGSTFVYVGIVTGQSVRGNNKWAQSAKGNFVWTGNLRLV